MSNRKAGVIHISINGRGCSTKGSFKYGFGLARRQPLLNSNGGVEGYKEVMESPPFVEGVASTSLQKTGLRKNFLWKSLRNFDFFIS